MRTRLEAAFFAFASVCLLQADALLRDDLYPFGVDQGDSTLQKLDDDASSEEFKPTVPIFHFGQSRGSLYVNANGFISFMTAIPTFMNNPFPLPYPIIAPLYADVDLRGSGDVFYRESREQDLLSRAENDLRRYFSSAASFSPTALLIVTWDNVGYFRSKNDKTNTFQLVVASDGQESYAFFLYPEDGIQWERAEGKNQHVPDAHAQAGTMNENSKLFLLKGSGTDQVRNLVKWSNTGVAGKWIFRLGSENEQDVIQPDQTQSKDLQNESCEAGASTCHSRAECVEQDPGFCCRCKAEYFGDGNFCLKRGVPLRLRGNVNGNVNGHVIENQDIHSYVLTADGRAYTAMSSIDPIVAYDLQSLSVLGSVVGWVFAVPLGDALNGFSLTGGVFNQTTSVTFPETGQVMNIDIRFKGMDVFDHLTLTWDLNGALPKIPLGSVVNVEDHEEEYTFTEPGIIRSSSRRSYQLENSEEKIPLEIQHTIRYTPCVYELPKERNTLRVKSTGYYITYDNTERIVRYAATYKITPVGYDFDPCEKGRSECGEYSSCVVTGDTYQCFCDEGYEIDQQTVSPDQKKRCKDIDECEARLHNCDPNAQCLNQQGSFQCQCNPGYIGNGIECKRQLTCRDLQCHDHADCYERPGQQAQCRCKPGYTGNGVICISSSQVEGENYVPSHPLDCSRSNFCDYNADCVYDEQLQRHTCRCRIGYRGDGRRCIRDYDPPVDATGSHLPAPESTDCRDRPDICHPSARCLYDESKTEYACRCLSGYVGSGMDCVPQTAADCSTEQNCHPRATCVYLADERRHSCTCMPGYEGDGYDCRRRSPPSAPRLIDGDDNRAYPNCYQGVCSCPEGFTYSGDDELCLRDGTYVSPGQGGPVYPPPYPDSETPLPDCTSGTCICEEPYTYDRAFGVCFSEGGEQSACNVLNNCHLDATCIYNVVTSAYECQCRPGYTGDGYKDCRLEAPSCVTDRTVCHANAACVYDDNMGRSVCMCNEGYTGDGTRCISTDECRTSDECDANAECIFNNTLGEYKCICKEGYSGDGFTCSLSDDTPCNIVDRCHPFASCIYSAEALSYQCTCNDGYTGDGYSCKASETYCNLHNSCHPNAECVWDSLENNYRCRCLKGFLGNGISCVPVTGCYDNPAICDARAICVPTDETKRNFTCRCTKGFRGNGYTCEEVPKMDNVIFMSQSMSIIRVPINGSRYEIARPIYLNPVQQAVGIEMDCQTSRLYWTDANAGSILSAYLDGQDVRPFARKKIKSPEGLTIDWTSRLAFWTDSEMDTVEMGSLETGRRRVLHSEGLVNPRGIAIHAGIGKLYWSDWDRAFPRIEESLVNGQERQVLIQGEGNVGLPNALTLDFETDDLCWADAGLGKIMCFSLKYQTRRVVAESPYPFGITNSADFLYWTDWREHSLLGVRKPGGGDSEVMKIPVPFGGISKFYDIVAAPVVCPEMSSVCERNNGGCEPYQMCVPNAYGGGRSCMCSDEPRDGDPVCRDAL